MDPISQMTLGAALPVALERRDRENTREGKLRLRGALLVGALAGAAPDLDVLIQSQQDPLLMVQFHRHFTHALISAPVIGAVVALLVRAIWRGGPAWSTLWRWGTLGALTHGLLDACTSYGTHLLWPFSAERAAWHIVGIIDPLYTLPLLGFVVATARTRRTTWVRMGLVLSLLYLGLGWVQRERAESFYREVAARRGDTPLRLTVKPTIGNLWLWRGIYEVRRDAPGASALRPRATSTDTPRAQAPPAPGYEFAVDAIWNFPFAAARLYPGTRTRRVLPAQDFSALPADSVARRDLNRFEFFSDAYLHRTAPNEIGDLRFSLIPNSLEPLWVVRVDPERPDRHLPYITTRRVTPEKRALFWAMLKGHPTAEAADRGPEGRMEGSKPQTKPARLLP